jgi:hypothetical protein
MGIPTIDPRSTFASFDADFLYSMARFRADVGKYAVLVSIIAEFEAFEPQLIEGGRQERALIAKVYDADALVERADDGLDLISDAVAAAATLDLKARKKKKESAPEYIRLYGGLSPSSFKRPVLGKQLESMTGWPSALAGWPNPTLQGYGIQLLPAIEVGKNAEKAKTNAEQALADFRISGPRKATGDKFNAIRKWAHGLLGQFAHDHPELNLPASFADDYFRHESAAPELSLGDLDRRIPVVAAELSRLEGLRAEKLAALQTEATAKAAAEKAGKAAALAEAMKNQEDINAHVAKLKAELDES